MKQLIIVRGFPGSGKSTLGEMLARSYRDTKPAFHIETDMFFLDKEGKYDFVQNDLGKAHAWCQDTCRKLLRADDDMVVVVSNTFTQLWEMKPYFLLAEQFDAAIQIIECKGRFGSVHNVPDRTIKAMIDRWEDIPHIGFWGKMKGEAKDEAAKLSRTQEQTQDRSIHASEDEASISSEVSELSANESYAG